MVTRVNRVWRRTRPGQGIVEYGLVIILIAIAVLVLLGLLGDQIAVLFDRITGSIAGT